LYAGVSAPVAYSKIAWRQAHVARIKNFVLSVVREQQRDPEKTVLITRIDTGLFSDCFYHNPFRLFGIHEVYLAPGGEQAIHNSQLRPLSEFVYPQELMARALAQNAARVFRVGDDGVVQDVTSTYYDESGPLLIPKLSRRVDAGSPLMADQLGPTWYHIEDHFRWMPKSASVRLGGPRSPADRLFIQGYAPPSHLQGETFTLAVRVNDRSLQPVRITPESPYFDVGLPLPQELVGAESVEVTVEVDRTRRYPGDVRELGLIFGVFEIR
jgi:hypothetical protein